MFRPTIPNITAPSSITMSPSKRVEKATGTSTEKGKNQSDLIDISVWNRHIINILDLSVKQIFT